ncbi:hypothetical protein AB0B31_07395 [Catellatospora citrea]|uniref:hypothetical protein n=1 Tax=Catellatospora citrea TaxID=53366 RepID=UPI0033C00C36
MVATLRRLLPSLLAWCAGAAVALVVGQYALSLVGDDAGDAATAPIALPRIPVAAGSAAPTPAPASSPGRGLTPQSQRTYVSQTLSSHGGTVVVGCSGDLAYLLSWSPAQGFHAEHARRGPAERVSVRFEAAGREYAAAARCVGGIAQLLEQHDD